MKVSKLSSNGFQIDNKQWFTVDKFKSPDLLSTIKLGDILSDIKTNKKGYVVSVVGDASQVGKLTLSDSSSSSFIQPAKFDYKDLKILRGQCLNIAFDNLSSNGRVLNFKDKNGVYINIEEGLDVADILFERIIERLK